jgi:Glutaredoxin-like protein, YruB-family
MNVKIYSTSTCPYCRLAKEYLFSKNVVYDDFDVTVDQEKAQEMVRITGQLGVPVIVIDDQVIIGFDKPRIDALIGGPA